MELDVIILNKPVTGQILHDSTYMLHLEVVKMSSFSQVEIFMGFQCLV